MSDTKTVLCMGNAIVDVIARVDDAFLDRHERIKGSMMLVDEATSAALYDAMPPAIERSGGSAANTAVGIAAFGGAARYIGKVRDDQLGRVFSHDIRAAGVAFETPAASDGPATATSMVLVTPDAQRTMNTYLGACVGLTVDDVDADAIKQAGILYVEGYLWDTPPQKEAVTRAMDIARENGVQVALTLSDSFCVDRFRAEFRALVEGRVDILFANEDELLSLYETQNLEEAKEQVRRCVDLVAVTRSEKGSIILHGDEGITVPALPTDVADSTGAGDLYAAGLLYALAAGLTLEQGGRLASMAAADVISYLGARPENDLRQLTVDRLGLHLPG
ncbi:adenosine kinase [Yunchengibacter salinarum]|uniref:adenosine kinase n=1 Tax=Yunchengibacter salinarum TaxID=3133399 RepID=UPI0035B634E2